MSPGGSVLVSPDNTSVVKAAATVASRVIDEGAVLYRHRNATIVEDAATKVSGIASEDTIYHYRITLVGNITTIVT